MPNEDGKDKDPSAKDPAQTPPPAPVNDDGDGDDDKPNKLSADQQKAFDKLLGKNGKLKNELDSAKTREDALKAELAAIKADKDAAEAEKLKQQGEYQKLYETEKSKTEAVKSRLIEAEIKRLAKEEGAIDVDVAALMVKRDSITIGDDFSISGVSAAVKAFKVERPGQFQTPQDPSKAKDPKETGAQVPPPPGAGDGDNTPRAQAFKLGSPEYVADRAKFLAEK